MIAGVTGASGMIGRRIVDILLANGLRVRVLTRSANFKASSRVEVIQGDICDQGSISQLLSGAAYLFHCAGEIHRPELMEKVNVEGVKTILSAIQSNHQLSYFCHISSAGVIGKTDQKIITESTPTHPQNTYEKSKLSAEQAILEAPLVCKTIILRPVNVVDEHNLGILKFATEPNLKNRVKRFINGNENAHLVHAESVARAAIFFMGNSKQSAQKECYFVSEDDDPDNTYAGIWSLYRKQKRAAALPWQVAYYLKRILGKINNKGNIIYSSQKLREAGFGGLLSVKKSVELALTS